MRTDSFSQHLSINRFGLYVQLGTLVSSLDLPTVLKRLFTGDIADRAGDGELLAH